MRSLRDIQTVTYVEMERLLDESALCNMIRPTGFGKTKLIADYCYKHRNQTFLYIYDTRTNRSNFINRYRPSNIEFVSYNAIQRLSKRGITDFVNRVVNITGHSCVIFDESHYIGSSKTELVFKAFRKTGKIKLLGASANGYRMDGKVITTEYFGGCEVFDYNMLNAAEDGIIVPPMYTAAVKKEQIIEDFKDYITAVDRKIIEECSNKGEILYNALIERFNGKLPSYMRMIYFLPTIEDVENVETDGIIQSMKRRLPDYTINVIKVTSSYAHRDGVEELNALAQTLTRKDKTIDFIVNCNMLNQGIHLNNLTAVLFGRKTNSDILFIQQFGRAVSVMQKEPVVLIDYVSNYERIDSLSKKCLDSNESTITYGGAGGRGPGGLLDICKITMSPKQIKLMEVLQKLNARKRLGVNLSTIKTAYINYGINLDCCSGFVGVPIKPLAELLDDEGVLRQEDKIYLAS